MKTAVIVPTYNRPKALADCLAALARQHGQTPEIVVVDDGGAVDLAGIVGPYGDQVRLIRQANSGPAGARNAGVKATQADFIAFTDDDCWPEPEWLQGLVDAYANDREALIGGRVENCLAGNPYACASQTLCNFLYDYFGAASGTAQFFTSNNMGCARQAYLALGGFDRSFTLAAAEDRDLGLRWRASGRRLIYAPGAVVWHNHNLTLKGFWRQHQNYGRGAFQLHQAMRRDDRPGPKFEGLRFYINMGLYPLSHARKMRLRQSVLMALSQVAVVSGYIRQRLVTRSATSGAAGSVANGS